MPKTQLKPIWKTSDGESWVTEAHATAQQKKLDALEAHEKARASLLHAFARSLTTADGHLFEAGDYWYVREWAYSPDIVRIGMLGYYWQEFGIHTDGSLVLVVREDRSNGRSDRTEYRISELYKSERAAKQKLAECLKQRLETLKQQIAAAKGEP